MAAGGALVLSGGGIWVGSCAVGCVLAVGGSLALVSDRPGTLGVEIGRETPILSAALAHSRPLVIRVLVVAGQPMAGFVP